MQRLRRLGLVLIGLSGALALLAQSLPVEEISRAADIARTKDVVWLLTALSIICIGAAIMVVRMSFQRADVWVAEMKQTRQAIDDLRLTLEKRPCAALDAFKLMREMKDAGK